MQHHKDQEKGSAQDIEMLIETLRDANNRAHQRQAAMALGQIKDPRAIEPLIEALKDNNSGVRERAAVALGQLGDLRAVESLIELLRDNDGWVRRQVAVALGQLGDARAIEPLIEALKDDEIWVREQVVRALERLGDARAVEALIESLRDKDSRARSSIIHALGQLGDVRAVEALIESLRDKDSGIRSSVATALGQLGDAHAIKPLIELLRDDNREVHERAIEALNQLGWQPDALQSAWLAIAQRNWDGVVSLGSIAVEPLIETLQENDKWVREQAVVSLGKLGDARAVEALIMMLKDNFVEVRRQVTIALGQIGDTRAVEALIEALSDRDSGVREQVVEALGQLNDALAIEPLNEALKDKDSAVRKQVAKVLDRLGWQPVNETQSVLLAIAQQDWDSVPSLGPAAVEPLIEVFRENDSRIRRQIVATLGQLGDTRAIEPLVVALKDKDSAVRKQVAEALNQLGWQPVNETQSVSLAIAQQDWDKVISLGPTAVESLIDVLRDNNSDVSESAARVLEKIGDRRGTDAILEHRFSDNSMHTPIPPTFFLSEISNPGASATPKLIFDPYAPITHSGGMRPPPKLENPSAHPLRKWLAFIIAIPILVLLASIVATIVIKATRAEHLPPTAGPWNVLLFVCQMILLTTAVCFTPTFVALFFYRRIGRIVSLLIEIVVYIVIFLGFAFWFLGANALGTWIFYAIALVLLIDIGSHYIEWYKNNTLKRIRNAALYQSIEIDVKALEQMKQDEVILYVPVPVGLTLGMIIGLILRQTTVQVIALCLQIVLLLSSFVLLYFLIVGFLRMADPLFKTIPKFLPALTKSRQKGKGKAKTSQASQETLDQHYIDLACDVNGLRMVYKYDALHNTILLVAFLLIVMKVWLFPIDIKWLIVSLLFATLIFCELPYAVGQYLLHTKILAQYTGGKYVEMEKKLQEYAPIFPPWAFLGALLTSGTAGSILYALLSQMIQNTFTDFLK